MTRLIAADVLKLRRRRGLMGWCLLLTVGLDLMFYGWGLARGLDPVGGANALSHLMEGLMLLGGVAPILLGASAGAGDLAAGVLRDLVATGRPRVQLFAARVPAVLLLAVPLALVAALVAGLGAIAFAGHGAAGLRAPTAGTLAKDAVWLASDYAFLAIFACGISTLLGTQATSIGLLLGWQLAASNLLLQVKALGDVRDVIPLGDLDRLQPASAHSLHHLAPGIAVAALVVWALAATLAGGRRTMTRDV